MAGQRGGGQVQVQYNKYSTVQYSTVQYKYRSGLTSLQERLQDSGSIHYPREATTDRGENNSVERSVKMFV